MIRITTKGKQKMNYQKKQLQQALSAVVPITAKDGIMSCVKFGDGQLVAGDNEMFVSYKLDTPENYCCNGKDLLNTIKNFPDGDISLEVTEKTVKIKSDKLKGNYKLPVISATDYPAFDAPDGETISITGLNTAIKKISYAASLDTIKPVFNGIHFDGKNFVSTDSRRLAVVTTGETALESLIMPLRFTNEVRRLFADDVSLTISGNTITASDENVRLTSRLVDGKFPNWQQVIPKEKGHVITVNVAQLKGAAGRVVGYANQPAYRILFEFTGSEIKMSSSNGQGSSADEHINYEGDKPEIKFALNGQFLLETLANISGDVVTISLVGPMSPVVFSGAEDEKHVIMPIQVKEVAE